MRPYDRDAEAMQREAAKEAASKRETYLRALEDVMSTPNGRIVLAHLMEAGYVFATTFTGNSSGFFAEGRRALALEICNDLCARNHSLFVKTISENSTGEQHHV